MTSDKQTETAVLSVKKAVVSKHQYEIIRKLIAYRKLFDFANGITPTDDFNFDEFKKDVISIFESHKKFEKTVMALFEEFEEIEAIGTTKGEKNEIG